MEVAEGVRRMEKKVDGEEDGFWGKETQFAFTFTGPTVCYSDGCQNRAFAEYVCRAV